jgi:hypothetical protein
VTVTRHPTVLFVCVHDAETVRRIRDEIDRRVLSLVAGLVP